MAEVAGLKEAIQQGEEQERVLQAELSDALAALPNLPAADVPPGKDENDNVPVEARAFKAPNRLPADELNAPKEHFDLGEALGMMDFDRAARVSGSRFVYLTKGLARMERALASFMLDLHTDQFGYTEVVPPILGPRRSLLRHSQLPKFEFDQFWTLTGEDFLENADRRGAACEPLRSHPHRRSAADQLRPRGNSRRDDRCRCASRRTRPASAPKPARPARTRAA